MHSALVLIDKQPGWTSHDVVAKLRGILGTRKIGHAGTLDPMATGLLVLGIEGGTKLLQFISGSDKQYLATIRLGVSTHTDDAEGEVVSTNSVAGVTQEKVDAEIAKLTGVITQIPSSVSAIKVDGKRAYDLVREGKEVELKGRTVEVTRFERTTGLRYSDDVVDFEVMVDCSSGTYIRALARDIGVALGVGGHLTALRRTRIGKFSVDQAGLIDADPMPISMVSAAGSLFPTLEIDQDQARDLVHGKRINLPPSGVVACTFRNDLLAIVEPVAQQYRSLVVFPEVFNA
jgi:tRNA pseudouridine55 synthase